MKSVSLASNIALFVGCTLSSTERNIAYCQMTNLAPKNPIETYNFKKVVP